MSVCVQKERTEMVASGDTGVKAMRSVSSCANIYRQKPFGRRESDIEYPYYMLLEMSQSVSAASSNRILSLLLDHSVNLFFLP